MAARGLQETLPRGAPRLPQPPGSGSLAPATKAAVTGLWPWGADRTDWVSSWGLGLARAASLAVQTQRRSRPALRRASPPEKVSRAPARAGRVCTARQRAAPAAQRRALAPGWPPLITTTPAPRRLPAPRVPTAAHLALAAREGRGPGVALAWVGARLPTPSRVAAPRSARSAALLRGASAAAGWRLCVPGKLAARPGPRGGARRRPQRPEADSSGAAPPASPGPRRRRGPPDPHLRPASRPTALPGAPFPTLAECSGERACGPPPRVNPLAPGARAPIPKLVRPPGGTCVATAGTCMSTAESGGVFSGEGLSPTNAPGAADGLSREEKLFSRRFHLHSQSAFAALRDCFLCPLDGGQRALSVSSKWAIGGSKPFGLLLEVGLGGWGGDGTRTNPK